MPVRTCKLKRIITVCQECLAESPVKRSFNFYPWESFDHVQGDAGDIELKWTRLRAAIVEVADRCCGRVWCLSGRQNPNLLVDTSGEGCRQAEGVFLSSFHGYKGEPGHGKTSVRP